VERGTKVDYKRSFRSGTFLVILQRRCPLTRAEKAPISSSLAATKVNNALLDHWYTRRELILDNISDKLGTEDLWSKYRDSLECCRA